MYHQLRHIDLLKIYSNPLFGLPMNTSCSIMADEESALIKVASSVVGFHYYSCVLHVHQLAIRVS